MPQGMLWWLYRGSHTIYNDMQAVLGLSQAKVLTYCDDDSIPNNVLYYACLIHVQNNVTVRDDCTTCSSLFRVKLVCV